MVTKTDSLWEKGIITVLQKGEIQLEGQFLNSSNYTFLCQVKHGTEEIRAVYKPTKGERELWDFPRATIARREAAAYVVSDVLGWKIVPPVVYRRIGMPLGQGSLQFFVNHDPNHHYFNLEKDEVERLKPMVLFDIVCNNADRKGGHVLFDEQGHVWGIDHGLCFHVEDKLRTVIWDFIGQPIAPELLADLTRLGENVMSSGVLQKRLLRFISAEEIAALAYRCAYLVDLKEFPAPSKSQRSYPWPPV